MTFRDDLIEAFLDMMSAERGAGANTLAAYAPRPCDFAGFAKGGIAAASRDEIRAYLVHLSTAGLAASSQARRLSALRQFYRLSLCRGDAQATIPPRRSTRPRRRGRCPKFFPPPTWKR